MNDIVYFMNMIEGFSPDEEDFLGGYNHILDVLTSLAQFGVISREDARRAETNLKLLAAKCSDNFIPEKNECNTLEKHIIKRDGGPFEYFCEGCGKWVSCPPQHECTSIFSDLARYELTFGLGEEDEEVVEVYATAEVATHIFFATRGYEKKCEDLVTVRDLKNETITFECGSIDRIRRVWE